MYKVSFSDDFKKVERFNNKVTKVTLEGEINNVFGESRLSIPLDITNWMVDNNGGVTLDCIKVYGVSVRNNKDKDNLVLGERVAEARAKLKIYKFMKTFCYKMLQYYALMVYGVKTKGTVTISANNVDKYNGNSLADTYKKYSHLIEVENTHIKQLLYDY